MEHSAFHSISLLHVMLYCLALRPRPLCLPTFRSFTNSAGTTAYDAIEGRFQSLILYLLLKADFNTPYMAIEEEGEIGHCQPRFTLL